MQLIGDTMSNFPRIFDFVHIKYDNKGKINLLNHSSTNKHIQAKILAKTSEEKDESSTDDVLLYLYLGLSVKERKYFLCPQGKNIIIPQCELPGSLELMIVNILIVECKTGHKRIFGVVRTAIKSAEVTKEVWKGILRIPTSEHPIHEKYLLPII